MVINTKNPNWLLLIINLFLVCTFIIFLPVSFPKEKDWNIYKVVSGSMEPNIHVGSIVLVKKYVPADLKIGDVVTYKSLNQIGITITHRIIGINVVEGKKVFQTKGDANNVNDIDQVSEEQIIGKVVLSIPYLAYLSNFAKTPLGFIIIIFIPSFLILAEEFKTIRKIFTFNKWKNLLVLYILFNLIIVKPTFSFFTDHQVITNNHFSTAYWTAPSTAIINFEPITNNPSIRVEFTKEFDSNLNFVQLCYSYNSSDFVCPDAPAYQSSDLYFDINLNESGVYSFYTQSHTENGLLEDINNLEDKIYSVILDTKSPTTNLSIDSQNQPLYLADNLLTSDWQILDGVGEHHFVSDGVGIGETFTSISHQPMYQLGFKDYIVSKNSTDTIYQSINIPQNLDAYLNFNFRTISYEIAPYAGFFAQVRSLDDQVLADILTIGNKNFNSPYDSGWQNIIYPLNPYQNQPVKIWFSVELDHTQNSQPIWTYLDDIKIITQSIRTTDPITPSLFATDFDSEVYMTTTLPEIIPQYNQIIYQSTDLADNQESLHHVNITVLPQLVLNKVYLYSDPIIEIFNNSSEVQNTAGIYFKNGIGATWSLFPLDIAPTSVYQFTYSPEFVLSSNDDLYLIKEDNGENIIDHLVINSDNLEAQYYQRIPTGLGNWFNNKISDPTLTANLALKANKVLVFSITNVSKLPISYELKYNTSSEEKGVFGTVNQDEDGIINREFVLGTCSSGGNCVYDSLLDSNFSLKLYHSSIIILEKNFNLSD